MIPRHVQVGQMKQTLAKRVVFKTKPPQAKYLPKNSTLQLPNTEPQRKKKAIEFLDRGGLDKNDTSRADKMIFNIVNRQIMDCFQDDG